MQTYFCIARESIKTTRSDADSMHTYNPMCKFDDSGKIFIKLEKAERAELLSYKHSKTHKIFAARAICLQNRGLPFVETVMGFNQDLSVMLYYRIGSQSLGTARNH